MSIFEMISKLITEHGSAEVLQKHLDFAKDEHNSTLRENVRHRAEIDAFALKFADLEEKVSLLESEKAILKAENESMKAQLEQRTKEKKELSEGALAVLGRIAPIGDRFCLEDVAYHMGVDFGKFRSHFDELQQRGLVGIITLRNDGHLASVTSEGRAFHYAQVG